LLHAIRIQSLHHVYSKDRQGTLCLHVQNDGVLFVRVFKLTGHNSSACAKERGTIFPPMQNDGVLFRRGTIGP